MITTVKNIVAILILCYQYCLFSQTNEVKGIIINEKNKPIEYVNVGVLNGNIGTVSNSLGEFTLKFTDAMLKDTLRFSCLGFTTKDLHIQDLVTKRNKIVLITHSFVLDEIVIGSKKRKEFSKGKERVSTKSEVFFTRPEMKILNLGSQIGRKFNLKNRKSSLLKTFRFYVKDNNFSNCKFRINIYNETLNRNKNSKNIYVEVKDKFKGWVQVDLSQYSIETHEDIIISVEWIEASNDGDRLSLPLSVPSFGSVHYYKFSSQKKWKKYSMISTSMVLEYLR